MPLPSQNVLRARRSRSTSPAEGARERNGTDTLAASPLVRFQDASKEVRDPDAKALRKGYDLREGWVTFSAFDAADIVPVGSGPHSQFILRQVLPQPVASDVETEATEYRS